MGLAGSRIREGLSGHCLHRLKNRSANYCLLQAPDFLLQIPFQETAARDEQPAHPVPDPKDRCLLRRQGLWGAGKAFIAFM
jgi:hypothetical protein